MRSVPATELPLRSLLLFHKKPADQRPIDMPKFFATQFDTCIAKNDSLTIAINAAAPAWYRRCGNWFH